MSHGTVDRDHFVGKRPADTAMEEVFAPTGRFVEMALAVAVDFEDGTVSAERISWVR